MRRNRAVEGEKKRGTKGEGQRARRDQLYNSLGSKKERRKCQSQARRGQVKGKPSESPWQSAVLGEVSAPQM